MNLKSILQTSLILIILSVVSIYPQGKEYIKTHYNEHEYRIEMRDGVKLFTAVYSPKDTSVDYPLLMVRTPYSAAPYGEDNYQDDFEVPEEMVKDGYIFVFQDVRGRFMSEGSYFNMRPYIPDKKNKNDVDESSDTYDTIDWLVKHISHNNGKAGMWGISYPGFYAAMGSIDAHPALAAVSPEAPIANWFIGDDMHHNGAFSLLLDFDFFANFGRPRDSLTTEWPEPLPYASPDAYNFFLNIGPLSNVNKNFFHHNIAFWDSTINHPNYDYYWKAKNNLPHFHNVTPAMLIVGGWYDAEDLYGPLHIYKSIEEKNPHNNNYLVMGPWFMGDGCGVKGILSEIYHSEQKQASSFSRKCLFLFLNITLRIKEISINRRYMYFRQAPMNGRLIRPGRLLMQSTAEFISVMIILYLLTIPETKAMMNTWQTR